VSERKATYGLRTHDVHQGLHAVDRNTGLVGRELERTQIVGMAAAVATAIKGQDVVGNAQDFKTVAAEQLDVDRWAFEPVVELLAELSFVRQLKRGSQGTESFYETVPDDFESLYSTLGEAWEDRGPGELERSLVETVDVLSYGPRPVAALDIDPGAVKTVLELGSSAESIQTVQIREEEVAYSPFFAYERPEAIGEAIEALNVEHVQAVFASLRTYQGAPLSRANDTETLSGLVAAGLVAGPALEAPNGGVETFAIAPYGLPPQLRTLRRPVLDKALAIVAAVRMGEHFGGVTSLRAPVALLQRLLEPEYATAPHTSTRRQYAVLHRLGIVRFVGSGEWRGIQLVDTADNREAVELAINLLAHGEATTAKEPSLKAQEVLLQGGTYRYPIQAVARTRRSGKALPATLVERIFESAMGRQPIE
jgi:hypothetical protein